MRLRLIPLLLASLVIPAFADISDDLAKADRAFDKGNYRDAFHYYSKYAEEGNAHARARLAMMYEKGILVGKDLERAQALYQGTAQALEQAAAPVAPAAGETGNDSSNDPAANPDNQAQAAQAEVSIARPQPGNAEAQYRLALAYLNGHGMPKDAWKGANCSRKRQAKTTVKRKRCSLPFIAKGTAWNATANSPANGIAVRPSRDMPNRNTAWGWFM